MCAGSFASSGAASGGAAPRQNQLLDAVRGALAPRHLEPAVTPAYRLEPVELLGSEAVRQVRRIYEAGFPAHLRASFGDLTDRRQPGELAFALGQAGRPCGFAMLRPLGGTGWTFMRYFVLDAARRGRGIGGIFWDHLADRLRGLGSTLLIFDVEDPDEPGCDRQESLTRSRRISFYLRQGAALLPVRGYRTPHGNARSLAWTPMLLMAAPLATREAAGEPAGTVSPDEIVAAVYRYRWSLPPDHPRVACTRATDSPEHRVEET